MWFISIGHGWKETDSSTLASLLPEPPSGLIKADVGSSTPDYVFPLGEREGHLSVLRERRAFEKKEKGLNT